MSPSLSMLAVLRARLSRLESLRKDAEGSLGALEASLAEAAREHATGLQRTRLASMQTTAMARSEARRCLEEAARARAELVSLVGSAEDGGGGDGGGGGGAPAALGGVALVSEEEVSSALASLRAAIDDTLFHTVENQAEAAAASARADAASEEEREAAAAGAARLEGMRRQAGLDIAAMTAQVNDYAQQMQAKAAHLLDARKAVERQRAAELQALQSAIAELVAQREW